MRNVLAVVVASVLLSAVSCSMPRMNLRHQSALGTQYQTHGELVVREFNDNRPPQEKVEKQTVINSMGGQVWSYPSNPNMMTYFQKTLIEEAGRTKISASNGAKKYDLTGSVNSMKLERNVTIFRYLTLGLLDFPKLSSTVDFNVEVKSNGVSIMNEHIQHAYSERYWAMTEMSFDGVSEKGARVLDRAVTDSIKLLFDKINDKISASQKISSVK